MLVYRYPNVCIRPGSVDFVVLVGVVGYCWCGRLFYVGVFE